MRLGVLAAVLGAAAAGAAEAQVVTPRAPDPVRKYAPILWLAPDELTYPMLPHPFAFDGVDNDGDGCVDVADADEVRLEWWVLADAQKRDRAVPPCPPAPPGATCKEGGPLSPPPCWTISPPPRARVLYADPDQFAGETRDRARSVPAAPGRTQQVKVEADQAGVRAPRVGPKDLRNRLGGRRLHLFQYWFYYPYDDGPNGHPDDGEHVSIFVEEDADGRQHVKGIVGAGHMPHNVNNILVTGTARSDAVFPRELRPHMPIMVELGKHASAPDRNCNGRFDLGFDANLYPEAVWGSRDVWAGNVGQALKVGDFESWFSYWRSQRGVFLESGWSDPDFRDGYAKACEGYDERLSRTLAGDGAGLRTYDLFPLTRLVQLHAEIAADSGDGSRIGAFLGRHAEEFWGGAPALPTLVPSPAAVAAMKDWTRHASDRREVWLHEGYRIPNNDFREWLFNRAGIGLSTKADAGNWVTGFSIRAAEVRLPRRILFVPLPGGIGGAQALHDSRVELYAHFDGIGSDPTPCGGSSICLYDAGIDFFSGRGRFAGTFVGLTWNEEYNARSWYQHLGLGAGVEVALPSVSIARWTRPFSLVGTAGLSAQLFRPRNRDVQIKEGAPLDREVTGVRAHVGLRLTYGFWRPRHPLSY